MDRHWFPAILLGFSVALALVFAAVLSPQGQELLENNRDVREITSPVMPVSEDAYVGAVTSLLTIYAEDQDSQATYDALISVRVPANMLNLHYELVIAFGKLASGDEADGLARLAALKAQYPWLTL